MNRVTTGAMKLRPSPWVIEVVLVILLMAVIWFWFRYVLPDWIRQLDGL